MTHSSSKTQATRT